METALFDKLIEKVRLKSEATQIIIALEEYLANSFAPPSHKIETPMNGIPEAAASILKESVMNEKHEVSTETKRTILELEEKLRRAPVIQLTLAFQPDEDAITEFADHVKKNLGTTTLMDLQYDKTIVAGALLIANGRYKDYSVRKKLADRFQIQKDEIMKLVASE